MSFNFQVSLESKRLIPGMATTEMALKRTVYARLGVCRLRISSGRALLFLHIVQSTVQ